MERRGFLKTLAGLVGGAAVAPAVVKAAAAPVINANHTLKMGPGWVPLGVESEVKGTLSVPQVSTSSLLKFQKEWDSTRRPIGHMAVRSGGWHVFDGKQWCRVVEHIK